MLKNNCLARVSNFWARSFQGYFREYVPKKQLFWRNGLLLNYLKYFFSFLTTVKNEIFKILIRMHILVEVSINVNYTMIKNND